MANQSSRPFRAKLFIHGTLNLKGVNYPVVTNNLSTTGVLAQFSEDMDQEQIKSIEAGLSPSKVVQLNLPEINFDSSAEVVRIFRRETKIFFAIKFLDVSVEHESGMNLRKGWRKKVDGFGHILIDGEYIEFKALNLSDTGLMLVLPKKIVVPPGTVAVLEFKTMELSAKVKIVWLEYWAANHTALGLEFIVKY